MRKILFIANMMFASAAVFGMDPATALNPNSRSYYSQKEDILRSKQIESFDELMSDWNETKQRCSQLRQELRNPEGLSNDQRKLAEGHLKTNAKILRELDQIIEKYLDNSVINAEGNTLLIRAIQSNNINLVSRILDPYIAQMDVRDSIFFLLVRKNRTGMSNEKIREYMENSLVSRSAKIKKNKYGVSPLFFALRESKLDIADKLLKVEASVNERFGEEPYLWYILQNWINSREKNRVVRWLIDNGADVNESVKTNLNCSLHYLHNAVLDRDQDLVKYLVEHGADIDALDEMERTPLLTAVLCQYHEVAQCLVSCGAAVKDQEKDWGPMFFVKRIAQNKNSPSLLKLVQMMNWSKELQDLEEEMADYDNAWINESLKMR